MNAFQVAQDYIRDERDFVTPLSLSQRLQRFLSTKVVGVQAVLPQYPTTWIPGLDISGIGQTQGIAAAFPELYANGWKFIIIRASIGLTKDVLFDYFWQAAKDAGLYLMSYHFGYPAYSGQSQGSLYLKTIEPMLNAVDGHSAAVFDVEAPGDITAWRNCVTNFHNTTKSELVTGDYSSISKWQSCTGNMVVPGFAWNASWSSLVDVPSFAPATRTKIRQIGVYLKHLWVPRPPGVNEDVDVNYFMGTETELREFLGYDDTTPPTPPPSSDLEKEVAVLKAKVDAMAIEISTNKTTAENELKAVDMLNRTEHMTIQNDISNLKESVKALEEGGVPSTKPAFQVGGSTANCRIVDGYNNPDPPATPKPIMVLPPVGPHRIQFKPGTIVLLASNEKVDADGSTWYYLVDPSQYPAGEPAQYIRTTDGALL